MQGGYSNSDLPVGDLSRVHLLQVRELDPGGLRDLRQRRAEDALQLAGVHQRRLGLVRRRLVLFRRSQVLQHHHQDSVAKLGWLVLRKIMLFCLSLRSMCSAATERMYLQLLQRAE